VICDEGFFSEPRVTTFTSTNIGKLVKKTNHDEYFYMVRFYDIPKDLDKLYFDNEERSMSKNEIIYWTKNKKDLMPILQSKNFNIW